MRGFWLYLLTLIGVSPSALAFDFEISPQTTYCFESGAYKGHSVYVGSIEKDSNGKRIFHVSVQGPFVISTADGVKVIPLFGHMPFSTEAIRKTPLIKCISDFSPENSLQEGVAEWRRQKGGVYSIGID